MAFVHWSDHLHGKRTREKVRAVLATLKPGRGITNAQIAAWCSRAGRWPKTAERLADVIVGK